MTNTEFQPKISDSMKANDYHDVYETVESSIDAEAIAELEKINDPAFDDAVVSALSTSSDGEMIYQGCATAVMVDIDGNIKAFFTNNNESSEHALFVKAAIEKATARALLEKENKKRGLSHSEDFLKQQGFARHDGASQKPIRIDGVDYFIGVSGAAVDDEFNKKAMRSEGLFAATEELPEYRGAGYWDRFCANRIRTYLKKPDARQDMGKMLVPRQNAKDKFFN